MKKSMIAIAAVAMLAIMIPFTFAEVVWPPCQEFPGRTPGYWKHQINVLLENTNGAYSWYFDDEFGVGVKMNNDYMNAILADAGVTAEEALTALQAKGPGSAVIRDDMAALLNYWAHLDPYTIV